MGKRSYCVYIMTNATRTVLYTGVTNNLGRRVFQHNCGKGGEFTKRYKVNRLVYYESSPDASAAIQREKRIKRGSRQAKMELVTVFSPEWRDLYETILRDGRWPSPQVGLRSQAPRLLRPEERGSQ